MHSKALVAAAIVAMVAACGKSRSSGGDELLKYLPEGSRGIAVVRVKPVLSSPLFQLDVVKAQVEDAKDDGDFKVLIEAGIDPFSNVDIAMLAGDPESYKVVAVLSGSFDAAKAADALNGSIRNISAIKDHHKRVAVAVGANTIIVGTREAVDSAKAGKGVAGSPALAGLVDELDRGKAVYAAIALPPSLVSMLPDPTLQKVQGVRIGVGLSDGVDVSVSATFDSPDSAAAVKKLADGVMPMAKSELPAALVDAISLRTSGAELQLTVSLGRDAFSGDNAELARDGVKAARRAFRDIIRWLTLT